MIDVLAHNYAPDETWVLEWLSSPRLQTYLDASGNNLQRALRLYEWNINLGQTLMKDIAFFEVALRNAYNREIDSRWDGTRHWLFDMTIHLSTSLYHDITEPESRSTRTH